MKKYIGICYLVFMGQLAIAQVPNHSLSEDPVFSTVLRRRIQYPINAEREGVYAKIYAGFHIDKKGHIQQVSILNPSKVGYGFEEEVLKKLKLLPPLQPKYEGNYALPITFAFIDHTNHAKPVSPSGKLSRLYLTDRILLNEVEIIGGRIPEQRDKVKPQSLGHVITTNQ
ncbi:energy transducer TonB [Spirosoma fluviale]|uniref:TonB protein C-terminal n=1 Tax=Spirosoma fluviale TaxID=1597977 RepID=A0A286GDK3_9BACT|nr:energy transducer TonB [Spirosoma fluviale]SOD93572.1 TonB protein C-terminal [Spirosoma fluviale]